MELEYDEEDIAATQKALNFYPDASPFWDSREGEDMSRCAQKHGIVAENTNQERIELYRQRARSEERLSLREFFGL